MLAANLEYIGNYLSQQSSNNICKLLTTDNLPVFNINDYYYLHTIEQMENPTLGMISKNLHLTKPAISALVKRLQNNGLAEKVQSEEDKRIFYLKLTEKAHHILQCEQNVFDRLSDLISHSISPDELHALDCLLQVIIQLLPQT